MFRDLIDDLDGFSTEPERFLDVPFVPSDDAVVKAMLQLAGVGRKDTLYDLGSGDGRIVIAAAQHYRARAIGIELDPQRIADAMEAAGDAGVEFQVDFIEESIFDADFSEATVITLYLLDSVNAQLKPRFLEELQPGTRIVSHAFDMGDWQADEQLKLNGITLYKWIVPALVAGTWEWEDAAGTAYRVDLLQKNQEVSGQAWLADTPAHLSSAQLCGNQLELEIAHPDLPGSKHFTLSFENAELASVWEIE